MELSDSFFTIKSPSEIEIKIKGSKFFGRARQCENIDKAEKIIEEFRKKYYDATHNCFAYRVGLGKEIKFRYSDDGEPSGTAGKPIYDQIEGKNLTNLIVVVTRYYGGTKLGTGGLTHAYSDSAAQAINAAGVIEKFITRCISMTVEFYDYNIVERIIHQIGAKVIDSNFSDIVRLKVESRLSLINNLKAKLIDSTSGRIKFE
ncbi:MAG: YigZ family protein [Candidatus Zixiibacteriota bacterium]|nr:MAG: YigZ family protein [candidate division Zixibacteria bacterium]